MKKLIIIATAITISGMVHAATYYVSVINPVGSDSNPGTLALPWLTITKAAQSAAAGDIVYIKAGNYGHEHVVVNNSGTSSAWIRFIGYKTTPGDTGTPAWLDLNQTGGYDPPTTDPAEMPLIDGTKNGVGVGITVSSKSYVEIKNIQVSRGCLHTRGYRSVWQYNT